METVLQDTKKTVTYPDNNPKTAFGMAKIPSLSVIPSTAILELGKAFNNGASKYGAFNWREGKISSSVYMDAAMRHLLAWYDGEELAEDSGVHHLGHAMACLALVLDSQVCGTLNDNRPKMGGPAPMIIKANQ